MFQERIIIYVSFLYNCAGNAIKLCSEGAPTICKCEKWTVAFKKGGSAVTVAVESEKVNVECVISAGKGRSVMLLLYKTGNTTWVVSYNIVGQLGNRLLELHCRCLGGQALMRKTQVGAMKRSLQNETNIGLYLKRALT